MNVAVTGANGFIGKNLISHLNTMNDVLVFPIIKETSVAELNEILIKVEFVFHLAGVNRPNDESEFVLGNVSYTEQLISILKELPRSPEIVFTSSTQAELMNDYGQSKKHAETILNDYAKLTKSNVYIYRLPNVFGKWSRPNYNSAVATFCHNVANDIPITIHDSNSIIHLSYIDDVVNALIGSMKSRKLFQIDSYQKSVGEIASMIQQFKQLQIGDYLSTLNDTFTKQLYSTYATFLPIESLVTSVLTHNNERGSFTEFARNDHVGQFSINVSKPGIVKGNHWHKTKHEKFIVISGSAVIRLRHLFEEQVHEFHVNSSQFNVVDIPSGYVHHIENVGKNELITIMWANELFTDDYPDTYPMEVYV